jgi:hypothetical protein
LFESHGGRLEIVDRAAQHFQAHHRQVSGIKRSRNYREAYRSFAQLFPRVPYVTDDAIRAALSVTDHPKAASANPKDFYDNRFLQELESSGFVKDVYAGK